MRNGSPLKKKIWATAGGKGGTGKTVVTSNMALLLAELGHKVILVDADLGSANLHTCLGVRQPGKTLSDFIFSKDVPLESLAIDTPYQNLKIISGSNDRLSIANMQHAQKTRLLRHIEKLEADYILIDLGAGTNFNVLDFFLRSDMGVLVVMPEPTSIENLYRFIKSAVIRIIKKNLPPEVYKDIKISIDRYGTNQTMDSLIEVIKEKEGVFGYRIKEEIDNFTPKLIVNQIRSSEEAILGPSISEITQKYLGVRLDYIGHVSYDDTVHLAVKNFTPFLLHSPNCKASIEMRVAMKRLLAKNTQ
ncbi:MAG: AAA family ATPase [Nitrospinota bacterium]|nr:AAA family ATPase [Nitrospinota bacterium]